jgi:hypothetical protein
MEWLIQAFNEKSIIWLLLSSIVAMLSGFVSSWLTYTYISRREILEKSELENRIKKQERIRQEIIRWSNPILASVQELKGRLNNIVDEGYLVLSKDYERQINSSWSISYDYFMNSTLYLFGQYFCWTRMLEEELNFELFESQIEKDNFFFAMRKVSKSLSTFPPSYSCSGRDVQIFRLQQRVIGELLVTVDSKDRRVVISYADFLKRLEDNSDDSFKQHFFPLQNLLEDINPESGCRWKRLLSARQALKELELQCTDLLKVVKK